MDEIEKGGGSEKDKINNMPGSLPVHNGIKIDHRKCRYPNCIVWTPIPCLTLTEISPVDESFEELENDDQGFKCNLCEKIFIYKYRRTEHIKHVHSSLSVKKICLCEFCGNVFSSTSTLLRHQRTQHTGISNYRCNFPECNKVFPDNGAYMSHVSSHLDIKDFSCEKCEVKFRYKQNLARHQRENQCQKKKPHIFICEYCGSEFSTKDSLDDHKKGKHSGYCYKCGCGKTFKWRSSLSYHRKKCNL